MFVLNSNFNKHSLLYHQLVIGAFQLSAGQRIELSIQWQHLVGLGETFSFNTFTSYNNKVYLVWFSPTIAEVYKNDDDDVVHAQVMALYIWYAAWTVLSRFAYVPRKYGSSSSVFQKYRFGMVSAFSRLSWSRCNEYPYPPRHQHQVVRLRTQQGQVM